MLVLRPHQEKERRSHLGTSTVVLV